MSFWRPWRGRRHERKSSDMLPEALAKLEKMPVNQKPSTLEKKHFQFVLVGLREGPGHEMAAIASRVVDTCADENASLGDFSSVIISVYFGTWFSEDSKLKRLALVSRLLAENGEAIRIAHGECEGLVGSLRSRYRMHLVARIPRYQEIVEQLSNSDFGTATEIPSASSSEISRQS